MENEPSMAVTQIGVFTPERALESLIGRDAPFEQDGFLICIVFWMVCICGPVDIECCRGPDIRVCAVDYNNIGSDQVFKHARNANHHLIECLLRVDVCTKIRVQGPSKLSASVI